MTITSSTSTAPANVASTADESSWDDFTQLTGIGPATQRQLHEALGIHTFVDLSRLAPHDLRQRFRELNRAISNTQATSWISQAHAFINDIARMMAVDSTHHETSQQGSETDKTQTLFVAAETEPPGILNSRSVTDKTATTIEVPSSPRLTFRHRPPTITQVCFHQPWRYPNSPVIGIATAHQPMYRTLKRMEPFALTIHFQCPALELREEVEPRLDSVEVYAHHRDSMSVKCLGHLSQPIPKATVGANASGPLYSTVVANAYLSRPGLYRLKILVTLASTHTIPGYLELPMIQVI